ncbi:MAG: protoheme IX farnesyltransferase [Sphingobacteriia bacterium 24-36-13]|jgi:protoheme IX farnesyltransferase|uniref:heme o synthase n=1 Tax=Sediminibacterium sp. TaxID=1917865 RepID=UPI000BD2FA3C|nr:heme o synthase [Sediminibacterium sp.]OYY11497.1 MAG: protoheme IX farnesyltransferase [Sphingobacteriia bacterium 35-36-14]OYZ54336.1 MAG: protoheme IX farnesyltransferase [Sphingobacteriia bacterium 24-36-13]OZA64213.1 MAG: protoheme IX farnesyltransferase [Sphingobacteriia bacterium 39-36-14]HQS24350.1 heme o synthase [Sediminibacterium sp.]HQS35696.1 heme o synthase [Sediminibacterium sp.]
MTKSSEHRVKSQSFSLAAKVKDYMLLIKFTLSFTVVFSCVICYLLAPKVVEYDWYMILLLFLAGMLITGSANAINQAVEKDTDAMMKRTSKRPVANGNMSQNEAYTFALIAGIVGVGMMWYYFNLSSALVSAFSLFLYAFIYTPLKKINSIAVLIGALPGALPCLIGWVAGNDDFALGGWVLFGMQFLWQFPHFWAIAWVAHADYTKAGFKLLPADKGPTKFTAIQTIMYSFLMIPIGMVPYFIGLTGITSLWIVLVCNLFMVFQSARLYKEMDVKAARRVMFSSYIYLPIVLLAMLADKINH